MSWHIHFTDGDVHEAEHLVMNSFGVIEIAEEASEFRLWPWHRVSLLTSDMEEPTPPSVDELPETYA